MLAKTPKIYTVSDGELVLRLEEAEGGWYCVTAPFEQGLVTQARTIEEAFEMAYDAREGLREVRQQLIEESRKSAKTPKASKAG